MLHAVTSPCSTPSDERTTISVLPTQYPAVFTHSFPNDSNATSQDEPGSPDSWILSITAVIAVLVGTLTILGSAIAIHRRKAARRRTAANRGGTLDIKMKDNTAYIPTLKIPTTNNESYATNVIMAVNPAYGGKDEMKTIAHLPIPSGTSSPVETTPITMEDQLYATPTVREDHTSKQPIPGGYDYVINF